MVLTPQNDALEAHCRRMAAWSLELEHALNASPAQLAEILELAEALEEHFAWEPFDEAPPKPDPIAETALTCLQATTRADLNTVIGKLPVFPPAAHGALQALLEDWHPSALGLIAKSDPALAAHLIRAANSWTHGPRPAISTIPCAITYVGAERTSRILCAAAMRPMFASAALRPIWNHSVESAEVARQMAQIAGSLHPEEAFLAGLMHDIGRLAMASLPSEFQARSARLIEKGCELVPVERAFCGFDHAEAGAIALRHWSFPEELIQAVEHHHHPERTDSKMAALLYLTEHWTNSCEDLPSLVRLKIATARLGLTSGALADFEVPEDRSLNALCFAASGWLS